MVFRRFGCEGRLCYVGVRRFYVDLLLGIVSEGGLARIYILLFGITRFIWQTWDNWFHEGYGLFRILV